MNDEKRNEMTRNMVGQYIKLNKKPDPASDGSALGSGADALALVSAAEKDMYSDKKSYYERHGLDRRRT